MVVELRLGIFLALALAVHNVAEAMALTEILRQRGMAVSEAAGLCVVAKITQPVLALAAFALAPAMTGLLPAALGFASGCLVFLVLTAVTFSLVGFVIGIWADDFERLQIVPLLVVTPLTFLGGSFYSIDMLPPVWRTVSLFNPVVYLVSGFRWSFYGSADVSVALSLAVILSFLTVSLAIVAWIFRTGYRLKT